VPGRKLVGDITYLPTWEGFAYLATVIDCCTKDCIGYVIAERMRAELVIDALRMAARNCDLEPEVVFHTDYAEVAAQLEVRHSVGRIGSCFDNAQSESFNATLKVERVNRTVYPTRAHARKDVTRYIEFRYNTKWLHSALGYRTAGSLRRLPESAIGGLTNTNKIYLENVGRPHSSRVHKDRKPRSYIISSIA
jgi:putative transposase